MFRPLLLSALLLPFLSGQGTRAPRPRPGVRTPGAQVPMTALRPEAVFEVPGTPDWIAVDKSVWISNSPKNTVARLDPKTNKVLEVVAVGSKPCSGLAAGFGSLWVPSCGDRTLAR